MSSVTINNLPAAVSIDGSADYLAIYTASTLATQKINRNTLLGLTSAPVGLSDSQSVSNKTLGNTNTITVKDTLFTLQDDGDTTKQAKFQLSGISTGTTRTFTLPDVSDTVVTLGATQTLTNKTLTSPTISAPTITNATLSADAITGFSVSNTGTIYGISVATGVISTANSIAAGTIVQNGVSAAQLATTAITLGYAQITSGFTTSSSTAVQVTGLTSTVTIPAGGRKVKITVSAVGLTAIAGNTALISIWDGTVGSGTQLAQFNMAATNTNIFGQAVVTPSAGSKTYNIGISNTGGSSTTLGAGATFPAFILVEAI